MNELFAVYEGTPEWAMWAIILSLGVMVLMAFGIAFRGYESKTSFVFFVVVAALSTISATSLIVWDTSLRSANSARASVAYEAREAWVQSHGVNLTKDTMSDLEFPSIYEKPTEDEDYGLAQVTNSDREIITVSLVWEDGEFVLYGTDGEPLERMSD